MLAKCLTIMGLALDMIGAFLLGVEAIKIRNLSRFKNYVLKNAHVHTLSPRLFYRGDEKHNRAVAKLSPRPSEGYPGLFQALHHVAGFALLIIANYVSGGLVLELFVTFLAWLFKWQLYVVVPVIIYLLLILVCTIWMLGEIVHFGITKSLVWSIKLVELIEEKTPDGTVGIIGLFTLIVGFGLQIIGTYISNR